MTATAYLAGPDVFLPKAAAHAARKLEICRRYGLRGLAPLNQDVETAAKAPEIWQTIHDTPGLLDLWQLHYAIDSDKAHNSPDAFIANVDTICEARWIKVSVQKDGTFRVVNSRDKYEKTYVKK